MTDEAPMQRPDIAAIRKDMAHGIAIGIPNERHRYSNELVRTLLDYIEALEAGQTQGRREGGSLGEAPQSPPSIEPSPPLPGPTSRYAVSGDFAMAHVQNDTGGQLVDRIVREKECRVISGASRATRHRWERSGRFPRSRKLGPNSKGWLLSELQAWVRGRG